VALWSEMSDVELDGLRKGKVVSYGTTNGSPD
jgi:hypothetical protein